MLNKPIIAPCRSYRAKNGWRRAARCWRSEKEATRLRDKLNAERLALPWVKVEKSLCLRHAGRDKRRWPTCSTAAAS